MLLSCLMLPVIAPQEQKWLVNQSVQEQTTGHDPVWIWANRVTGTQIPSHTWWPLAPYARGQSNIALRSSCSRKPKKPSQLWDSGCFLQLRYPTFPISLWPGASSYRNLYTEFHKSQNDVARASHMQLLLWKSTLRHEKEKWTWPLSQEIHIPHSLRCKYSKLGQL